MTIKEFLGGINKEIYLGIKSEDCDEMFAFGNKFSQKLIPYYDRKLFITSISTTTLLDENDNLVTVPYIELLIKFKNRPTVEEAVNKIFKTYYSNCDLNDERLKNDERYKTLQHIKESDYSVEQIIDKREESLNMLKINWDSKYFDRLSAYSEILMELEVMNFK